MSNGAGEDGMSPTPPSTEESKKETKKMVTKLSEKNKGPSGTRKPRKPSDEAVVSRARRMARAQLVPVLEALGLTADASEEDLKSALGEVKQARADRDGVAHSLKLENEQLAARLAQVEAERDEAVAAKEAAEAALVELESQYEAEQHERAVVEVAERMGVQDTNYGTELLRRHLTDLPDAEVEQIDDLAAFATKFFEGLKKEKAYLFKAVDTPAGPSPVSSTPQGGGTDAQVGGGEPSSKDGQPVGSQQLDPAPGSNEPQDVDALSMDRREFQRHAATKYGYRPGAG